MNGATRAWEDWVRFVGRPVDARPLVWVRILVPLAILGDLVDMLVRGSVDAVVYTQAFGGINAHPSPQLWLDSPWYGPLLFAVMFVTMPLISAGVFTRPAIVLGVLASAQLGHLYTPGDRAIDRLLRLVLILLLFSAVTRKDPPQKVAAWPVDVLKWLLVLIYLAAGIVKAAGPHWWVPGDFPAMYRIFSDPSVGTLDGTFWVHWKLPFVLTGWATLVLELSAPVLLTRWAPYWAVFGAFMHLGIAFGLRLGMFSWGMLALYPILLAPWIFGSTGVSEKKDSGV